MISGIVHFEEIVESVKDATGIENLRPYYDKLRRFVFHVEREIGGGGLIVRKRKQYSKGDGYYDGKLLIMPDDFVGEFSYGSLSAGHLTGNILTLNQPGTDNIDLLYLGYLLDENGNPFTTRNRLSAVVAYAVYRLYSAKVFLKQGNANLYQLYKQEYDDSVLATRGEEAFPTEEQWVEIGKIMNNSSFEAITDCGMMYFSPDGMYVEGVASSAICEFVDYLNGVSVGKAECVGVISFTNTQYMVGNSEGKATVTGILRNYVNPWNALEGVSSGTSHALGILTPLQNIISCSQTYNHSGALGSFLFTFTTIGNKGTTGFVLNLFTGVANVKIQYNGVEVVNKTSITGWNVILFPKVNATPLNATVIIQTTAGNGAWSLGGICPDGTFHLSKTIYGVATVTGDLTGIYTPPENPFCPVLQPEPMYMQGYFPPELGIYPYEPYAGCQCYIYRPEQGGTPIYTFGDAEMQQ